MTKPRDPEALLSAYLADGMEVLSDRVVDSVLDEVHRTRQRAVFGPWRTASMSRTALGAAAVVAVLALGGAFFVIQRGQPAVGGSEPDAERATQPQPARRRWSKRDAQRRQRRPRPPSRVQQASGSPPGRWVRLAMATPRCGSSMAGCSLWAARNER